MKALSMQGRAEPVKILLVEDNHGDVLLIKKAFQKSKIAAQFTVAQSGEDALAILMAEKPGEAGFVPDFILLDLNLPRKSGKDVLLEIKSNKALKHIPVTVLSSSRAEKDIVESYALYANSYIAKPSSLDKYCEIVASIEDFWFRQALLPGEAGTRRYR